MRKPPKKPANAPKVLSIHHHHKKPFRKRHLGLLIASIAGIIIIAALLISYRDQVYQGLTSAQDFVNSIFKREGSYSITVESSYGFSLEYDQNELYAAAFDTKSNNFYISSDDLAKERAYSIVRLTPYSIPRTISPSAMTITYHYQTDSYDASLDSLDQLALTNIDVDTSNLTKISQSNAQIDGKTFSETAYRITTGDELIDKLSRTFIVYSAIISDRPFTIVVSQNSQKNTITGLYKAVLKSISFSPASIDLSSIPSNPTQSPSLLSKNLSYFIPSQPVSATSNSTSQTNNSEKISALYSAAVVKIYSVYCMDISIKYFAMRDLCEGGVGSGFIINGEGYIGTNGHVAAVNPIDIAIKEAISYAQSGYLNYLNSLVDVAGISDQELESIIKRSGDDQDKFIAELYDTLIKKLTKNDISITKNIHNLVVCLGEDQPDIDTLLSDTWDKRKVYSPKKSSVRLAELIDFDYRLLDAYDNISWKASDVAVIKIDGNTNYPTTSLGSIDDVRQGSNLSIIGFPGQASDNGLVESSTAKSTLTSGKVSSIKNVSGSDKRVIETDTIVGHGNSGGPAFNDDGLVVGLATYFVSGTDDSSYGYIRDIQDLKDILASNSISASVSDTQTEWNAGIDDFYTSHYSRAVSHFEKVKALYPDHPEADSFLAIARQKIDNGEDITDFPLTIVIIAGISVVTVAGIATFLIIRHSHKHKIYQAGVSQGTVNPPQKGAPQQVIVSQPIVTPYTSQSPPMFPGPSTSFPPAPPTAPPASPSSPLPSISNSPPPPQHP